MRLRIAVFGVLLLAGLTTLVSASEVLEEPIAIVGDRAILRSEWQTQLALYAMQSNVSVNDPKVRDSIGAELLEQMINDQLLLIVAEKDTSMKVSSEDIDAALEEHILTLRRRYDSDEAFHRDLAKEGLTERDLRVRFRNDMRNQLLKQKMMQRKLSEVAVTHGEVREFYAKYKDSLPTRPAGIELAHILMPVEVSQEVVDSTREFLTRVLMQIRDGMEFAEAARQFSTDATRSGGGDLGWFGRGEMVPAFEEAAFALQPGQISGTIRSPFGWHLIQCIERSENRVHARHVVLTLSPTAADSAAVAARADSIARAARQGDNFCLLAQEFSRDEESQKNCGELGWYPIDDMFDEFKIALEDAEVDDIVGPVSTKFGWHVLRVLNRRPEHRLNLEDDWDAIKQIVRQDKTNQILSEWITEIREDTYVDVRPLSGQVTLTPGQN